MKSQPGVVARLWYGWKSLQLPWRRQRLAGYDLAGNTFWEFKDHLNANRMRRIVKYSRQTHHSEIKITPQWHQWLRHTRAEAPSVQEQQYEVIRQDRMKQLAAEADARWASQASFLDAPTKQQSAALSEGQAKPQQTETDPVNARVGKSNKDDKFKPKTRTKDPNPFGRPQTAAPGDDWQPQSWSPSAAAKR